MITHLACIMDGNRRWARAHGKLPGQGHMQGMKTAELVMRWCVKQGITHLSLYLFSLENFNRSLEEKHFLFFELFLKKADEFMHACKENNVRVYFVGDRSLFPDAIKDVCTRLEHETKECNGLSLYLLFCYGGQQEIVAASRLLADKVSKKELAVEDITLEAYKQVLWSHPAPSPDLIIRTGGMQRLSNFLLFSSAYAELIFLPQMWPDISVECLESVLKEFVERKRTFGN